MVQVKLPTRRSAGRADSGAPQSSQNSDDDSFTPPPSTPGSSSNRYAVPRAEFNFRFAPDAALPSVERPSTGEEIHNVSTPSTPVSQVPSFSITPSGSASRRISTPRTAGRSNTTINGLDIQLEGLRFSSTSLSMDMTGMSDALREAMAGRDSRSSPLLDPVVPSSISPSPGRPNSHRRRSSSRNNLEKHDVRDEAPPNDRFTLPGFQKALRDTKGLMTELADVLGSSAVHNEPDSVMQRLHSQAENLSQFECPSRRIVGFVGDSGAGKSSLLNSLLDCHDLARSSNGGGACTCVVTEFHFHEDRNFAIIVERFSETELMPQLKGLLRDYRHFHLNRDSFSSNDEVVDLEKRAGIASDTFQAMFPGRFIDKNTFMRDTESQCLSTLTSWVLDFDQSMIPERKSELGLDECSEFLMQLSSDTSSRAVPLWPWIKKIMVYLNAHILSKGLILVDLPGLRDLNSARRNITERYLLKCDEIFVVAAEGRATTDEGVQSVVELAKKARLSNVGIICTRSDEIKATEALKDWKGKRAAREIQEKLEVINREKSSIKDLEEEISSFEDIYYDDPSDEEARELHRLEKNLRSIRRRLSRSKFDLQRILVTTRNAIVEKKLFDLYRHEIPGDQLKVFCASNTIYWDWRDTPKDESMPHLLLSGILAIREHCMAMVSESQYAAAKKYMRDDIGVLLGELGLWVQSGQGSLNAERKENIRSTLDTLERKLYLELCGRASKLNVVANAYKREFDTKLYRPQGDRVGRWSAAAKGASNDWTSWHHASYSAFCRNYGTHRTATIGSRNWNEEIIEEMESDLSPPWEQVQIGLDQQGGEIAEFIDDVFEEADEVLDTELDNSPDTAIAISSTLLSQKRLLEADMQTILNDLEGDLRTLRTDALSSIRTSFIGKAMENAYDNARCESGGGSDARRKAIINSAVRRNGLFIDLLKSFRGDFNGHVDNTQDRIRELVSSNFNAIRGTFDIVRNDNVALECEMDPGFRRRVEEGLAATNESMRGVYDAIAA
ncbi:hypothetical protein E0Z10_g10588 [Xylaria hypoxylon]|uniref:G domain-containing protein n=1 Tax=Xylaria hypoxylon TaxID=37992 RepID=A0A4Z0YHF4_9PEZI|nr:hypothetical protein E0Z10_g10588 [Xylaria hypoxylon]